MQADGSRYRGSERDGDGRKTVFTYKALYFAARSGARSAFFLCESGSRRRGCQQAEVRAVSTRGTVSMHAA